MSKEMNNETDNLGQKAKQYGQKAIELFIEAEKLQFQAEAASTGEESRSLLKLAHSKDIEALAYISESNYLDHKRAEQLLAEIRKAKK